MSAGLPPLPPPAAGAPAPAADGRTPTAAPAQGAAPSSRDPAPRADRPVDTLAAGARAGPAPVTAPLSPPEALATAAPGTRLDGAIEVDSSGTTTLFRAAWGDAAVLAATPTGPAAHAVLEVVAAEDALLAVPVGAGGTALIVLAPHAVPGGETAGTLPAAFAELPPGAVVIGTVVPLPAAGTALLVGDAGVVRLEAPAPAALPHSGTRLVLEIVARARHIIAQQVSPARGTPARLALAPAQGPALARARAQAIAATGARGVLIPGRTVTGTVVEVATPRRRGPVTTPMVLSAAPKGATVALRLVGFGPSTPETAGAQEVSATVLGRDADGRLLVDMAERTVALPSDAPLPPGTALTFEMLPAASTAPIADPAARSPVIETLARMAAAGAGERAAVMAQIPGGAPSAVLGLIAYLLGLRAGDARLWLGEARARILERAAGGQLVERLGEDFRHAWRGGDAAGAPDWRQIPLPWQGDGQIHEARLWFGRERGEADAAEDGAEAGTRLVVDVDLSRLGRLRIDGLYRKRRFDVVLRSLRPLDQAARRNLRMIFDDVLAVSGLAGAIEFQIVSALGRPDSVAT